MLRLKLLSNGVVRQWCRGSKFGSSKMPQILLAVVTCGYLFTSQNKSTLLHSEEEKICPEGLMNWLNLDDSSRKVNFDAFYKELTQVLKPEQIEINIEELKQRGKPWNSYHKINAHPDVIVFPESTEDVSTIVKLCNKYAIPIVPFGGGTSLEGQTLTPHGGISIDFANMKQVLELNEQDLDVRVQAGLGYVELNEMLRDKKLWFPLDPVSFVLNRSCERFVSCFFVVLTVSFFLMTK